MTQISQLNQSESPAQSESEAEMFPDLLSVVESAYQSIFEPRKTTTAIGLDLLHRHYCYNYGMCEVGYQNACMYNDVNEFYDIVIKYVDMPRISSAEQE